MSLPSYINPKTAKQIQDLRPKVAEATAARESALAEVQRRQAAAEAADRSLAACDPDDQNAWDRADANARRLRQAQRSAEQALAVAESDLVTHERALFQALRSSLANPLAERMTVIPKFEAAHAMLAEASREVEAIAAEQDLRRAEANTLAARIGETPIGYINTHLHQIPIQDALRAKLDPKRVAAIRVEA